MIRMDAGSKDGNKETSCKTIAIIQANGGGLGQSGISGGVEKRSDIYIHICICIYILKVEPAGFVSGLNVRKRTRMTKLSGLNS